MTTSTPSPSLPTTAVVASRDAGPGALPPGPRAHPLVQTLAWAFAPTWLMDRCAQRIGDAFTLTFFPSGMRLVMLSDPQAVKKVFTAPPEVAPSAANNSPIAGVLGRSSVIIQTGPEHLRQRKLLLPPFHGERMREYEDVIVEATRRDMASWPLGQPMRMHPHTRAITLEVILRAVFGVEADRMEALREALGALLQAPQNPFVLLVLALRMPSQGRPSGALGAALDRVDSLIYSELRLRRAQSDLAERTDILSLLLQASDEDGVAMTDQELRDELVSLLLAGHETTATTVAWAVERLVRHPQTLRRLIAEIDAGEDDAYLRAVVSETLRVRPTVPIVARLLTEDFDVGGRTLPAGTRVFPSIYLTNRNPRVYDAPDEFRPERFLEESPDTFAWIPFGGGIRRCIGAAFAQLEARLMLRTVLGELEPSLPTGRGWPPVRRAGEGVRRRAITLVPADGARVVWRPRSSL